MKNDTNYADDFYVNKKKRGKESRKRKKVMENCRRCEECQIYWIMNKFVIYPTRYCHILHYITISAYIYIIIEYKKYFKIVSCVCVESYCHVYIINKLDKQRWLSLILWTISEILFRKNKKMREKVFFSVLQHNNMKYFIW